jgi:heterotetrameric sarcosine oxidase delta subunit
VRIDCPFCGERDQSEFSYFGDARCQRPDAADGNVATRFFEAVYLRDNPAGPHDEFWYHVFGCRAWLRVTRDTRSHVILAVTFADGGAGR